MKAEVVSFRRGAGWIGDGWRLFRGAPFAWIAIVFVYWLLMSLLGSVAAFGAPAQLGVAVAVVLVPAFSVGFMAAARSAARGAAPAIADLFAGFRAACLQRQLALGAVYALLLAAVLWLTTLADGGALARWMVAGERPEAQTLHSEAFRAALVLAALGYAPVMMMYWFAPVLCAWHGLAPAKALFFSFVATLVNWRAFLGYGLAAALLAVAVPFVVFTVALLFADGRLRGLAMGLVLPLLLVLLPILYASFFASYRDIFGTAAGAPGAPIR
ncbi:MAG: BPSS1780 family membrane protein [Burkholderiales bacterium]|nr:BPSS1780 family membrane protein [Burkholderiales bacterium]